MQEKYDTGWAYPAPFPMQQQMHLQQFLGPHQATPLGEGFLSVRIPMQAPVTQVHLDRHDNLLWLASAAGQVRAFQIGSFEAALAWRVQTQPPASGRPHVHPRPRGVPVTTMLVDPSYVLTGGPGVLQAHNRAGECLWHKQGDELAHLKSAALLTKSHTLALVTKESTPEVLRRASAHLPAHTGPTEKSARIRFFDVASQSFTGGSITLPPGGFVRDSAPVVARSSSHGRTLYVSHSARFDVLDVRQRNRVAGVTAPLSSPFTSIDVSDQYLIACSAYDPNSIVRVYDARHVGKPVNTIRANLQNVAAVSFASGYAPNSFLVSSGMGGAQLLHVNALPEDVQSAAMVPTDAGAGWSLSAACGDLVPPFTGAVGVSTGPQHYAHVCTSSNARFVCSRRAQMPLLASVTRTVTHSGSGPSEWVGDMPRRADILSTAVAQQDLPLASDWPEMTNLPAPIKSTTEPDPFVGARVWEPPSCLGPVDTRRVTELSSSSDGFVPAPRNVDTRSVALMRRFTPRGAQDAQSSLAKRAYGVKEADAVTEADRTSREQQKKCGMARATVALSEKRPPNYEYSKRNRTVVPGLDNLLPNSSCNALLQLLFWSSTPFRHFFMSHVCLRADCLSCQLGFLFSLLEQRGGPTSDVERPPEARQFLRVLAKRSEAEHLQLLDDASIASGDRSQSLAARIQELARFLLTTLDRESARPGAPSDRELRRQHRASRSLLGLPNKREVTPETSLNASLLNLSLVSASAADGGRADLSLLSESLGDQGDQDKQDKDKGDEDKVDKDRENTAASMVSAAFGTVRRNARRCRRGHCIDRRTTQFVLSLQYSQSPNDSIEDLLRKQLSGSEEQDRVYCDQCRDYSAVTRRRQVVSLPNTLLVAANCRSEEQLACWRERSFLPPKITLTEPSESEEQGCPLREVCYELVSVVSHVADAVPQRANTARHRVGGQHLVAHLRLPKRIAKFRLRPLFETSEDADAARCYAERRAAGDESAMNPHQWVLLNDFAVRLCSPGDAARFDMPWRQPCLVAYRRVDAHERLEESLRVMCHGELPRPFAQREFAASLLSLSTPLFPPAMDQRVPLQAAELPTEVAIDCEFVAVEHELRQQGLLARPRRMTLARVSCVRATGAHKGSPCMDEYVKPDEDVVDFLTQFSGLRAEDLDPQNTAHTLVTYKEAYCRLRCLVELGCTFVGHGLASDFRMLNLHVPEQQVRDTVLLFHLPKRRLLSLKFLARHVLQDDTVQADAERGHDSIEDASAALRLVDRYDQVYRQGELERPGNGHHQIKRLLLTLYDIGTRSGF